MEERSVRRQGIAESSLSNFDSWCPPPSPSSRVDSTAERGFTQFQPIASLRLLASSKSKGENRERQRQTPKWASMLLRKWHDANLVFQLKSKCPDRHCLPGAYNGS